MISAITWRCGLLGHSSEVALDLIQHGLKQVLLIGKVVVQRAAPALTT
jgi:hypothetical protein